MSSLLLSTVLLQIGSSCFNHFRGTKQAKDNLQKQMELEREITTKGIANARRQYKELCNLQKQLAIASHQDRISSIEESLRNTLSMEAYRASLKNWPLLVPPFVMKRDSLSLVDTDYYAQNLTLPVHCIMTPSMNVSFNKHVYPEFEQIFSEFIYKYWSSTTNKQNIIFYQNCWKYDHFDCGSNYLNIHSQLNNVPCIIIYPEESIKEGWIFRLHMWFNDSELFENNVIFPSHKIIYPHDHIYTEKDADQFILSFIPLLQLTISSIVDAYYWHYYGLPPILPKLIHKYKFSFDKVAEYNDIKERYVHYLNAEETIKNSEFDKSIDEILNFVSSVANISTTDEINRMLCAKLRYFLKNPNNNYRSVKDMIIQEDLFLQLTQYESTLVLKLIQK